MYTVVRKSPRAPLRSPGWGCGNYRYLYSTDNQLTALDYGSPTVNLIIDLLYAYRLLLVPVVTINHTVHQYTTVL